MNDVEAWVKAFDTSQGPKQTMDNLNWLVGQTKQLGERLQATEGQAIQMQEALQQNAQIVEKFVEQEDLVDSGQSTYSRGGFDSEKFKVGDKFSDWKI